MAGLTDTHRDILRHELAEAEAERERLDAAIAYLRRRLGAEDGTSAESSSGSEPENGTSGARIDPKLDVVAAINPGRFYGFTSSRAAEQILEMVGQERPLRTIEIFRAIKKGGGSIKDAETLARALKRNKKFHRVGRGLWGLKQWYPTSAPEWAPTAGEPEDDELDDEDSVRDANPAEPADSIGVQT